MKIIFLLTTLIVLYSCSPKTDEQIEIAETVNFYSSELIPLEVSSGDILKDKRYILLDNTDKNCMVGNIHKIEIKHNNIYILDRVYNKLFVFDFSGKKIGQVGNFGQGAEEYLDIADFDVDANGNIYCIDGRLDKLFVYSSDLRFKERVPLPFEADIIQITENGFLFGLSAWNTKKGKGYKVAFTDKDLQVKNTHIAYDEYIDTNYWISCYQFVETDLGFVYNQPIDNNIHIFNKDGSYKECINMDFGKHNVADEEKKNIENNPNFSDYTLLRDFVFCTERYMGGLLSQNKVHKAFIMDKLSNKTYLSKEMPDNSLSRLTGFCDGYVVSYVDFVSDGAEELPDSVQSHIQEEGMALCLQRLIAP